MGSTDSNADRRQCARLPHRGHGLLLNSESQWQVYIVNLSLQGALVAVIEQHNISENELVDLQVELGNGQVATMRGKVAHIKEHYIGLECCPVIETDIQQLLDLIKNMDG